MLALNPPPNTLERFLQEPDGNQYAQIARRWLQKLMERGVPGYRGLALQWGRKDVSHDARGILGYVEWYGDGNVKINVPYPKTPYQLEVFLHELGHIWLAHDIKNACNGKTRNCRPENRQEYEAESWAMDVLRQEGIPISDDMFSDAQDYVTSVLFGDMKDDLPISRDAVKFVEINDRLKAHDGWADFLEDLEGAQMINPATREQYRLAQAVLHGTARFPTRMTRAAAEKLIEDTPLSLRSRYMRNPAPDFTDLLDVWKIGKKRADELPGGAGGAGLSRETAAEQFNIWWEHERPYERPYNLYKAEAKAAFIRGFFGRPVRAGNPAEESTEVYEEFHGAPSEHITEISEEEHYHSHLAELGVLKGLKFRSVDGEKDITLDFDCDCDEEQSGNLFGFGSKKPKTKRKRFGAFGKELTTHSSRLMRSAYDAGYKGVHGYRGSRQFHEWLEGVTEDLDRGFVRQLQAEYARGLEDYHREQHEKEQRAITAEREKAQTLLDRKLAQQRKEREREERQREQEEKREAREREKQAREEEREARRGDTFLGYDIMPARGGGFVVPGMGGRYASIAAAKKAISSRRGGNPRKGPLASAREFVGQMGSGAAHGVDSFFTGNPADGDGPVILCSNEDKNQLYFVGGDQSVDLFELKLDTRHDSLILGECWAVNYTTQKKFDDFAQIEYVHIFGPEDAQTEPRKNDDLWEDAIPPDEEVFGSGLLPTLRYDVLNQTLHLDGGSYFVTDKGIEE